MDEKKIVSGGQGWMPSRAMWVAAAIGGITVIAIITYAILYGTTMEKVINTFDECVEAGGSVGESHPEQCFKDGATYVNSEDSEGTQVVKSEDYVGMSEQDAIDKAERAKVPNRVVERDGKPIAATMDFVQGRLNFHVKDGEVYSVYVESL